jgi:hypothetical protein
MANPASDTLILSSAQQKTAWNDLSGVASEQSTPADFNMAVGSVVPTTFKITPVSSKAAKDVPALKPYDFGMLQGKLLIVNPSDKKIVDVITS